MGWRDSIKKEEAKKKSSWKDTIKVEDYTQPEDPSVLDSFARGLSQGVTFDFGDEIVGAANSPIGALGEIANKFGADFDNEYTQEYKKERDESRDAFELAREINPGSYLAGDLAGGLATSLGTGGAATALKGGKLGVKGLMALAGLEGGVTGAGMSEGENIGDIAKDVAITGGLAAGGAGLIPKAAQKFGGGNLAAGGLGAGAGYYTTSDDDTLGEKATKIGLGAGAGLLGYHGAKKVIEPLLEKSGFTAGKQLGEEGTNIFKKEARDSIRDIEQENIQKQSRAIVEARDSVEDAISTQRKTATKTLQNEVAEYNKQIKEAAEEVKKLSQKVKEDVTLEGLERSEVVKSGLSQEVREKAKALSSTVDQIRKQAGSTINDVYDEVADRDLRFNSVEGLQKLKTELSQVFANTGADTVKRDQIQNLVEELTKYQGKDLPAGKFRELMKYVQTLGYDTNLEPNIQRILKGGYNNLNGQAVKDLSAQGAEDLAQNLTQAKSTYYNVFLLESLLSRYGTTGASKKAATTVEKLAQSGMKSGLGADLQERLLDPLKKILPEDDYSKLTNELFELSESYAKSGKGLPISERNALIQKRLQEIGQRDPKIGQLLETANTPKRRFDKGIVEDSIPSELREKQIAVGDIEKLAGKQQSITSTGEVQPSGQLYGLLDEGLDQAKKSRSENYKKLLPKVIGEEQSDKLITEGKNAFKNADLVRKSELSAPAGSSNILAQVAKYSEAIAIGAGNALGVVLDKSNKANMATVTEAIAKARPETLGRLYNVIRGNMSDATADILLKAAESTDPIRRRALLFTLQQNPEFRKIFSGEDNE